MAHPISEERLMKMQLHEAMTLTEEKDNFGSNRMIKVVGGWIYWRTAYATLSPDGEKFRTEPRTIAGVFVPEPKTNQ